MVKIEVDNIGASLSHKGPDNSMIALHGKFDTIAPWCVVNLEESERVAYVRSIEEDHSLSLSLEVPSPISRSYQQ